MTSSDEVITVEEEGQKVEYRVGDYYNIENGVARNKIVAYVEDQYIKNNNPNNVNNIARDTYLTNNVGKIADKFQEKDLIRARKDRATKQEEDLDNRLELDAETYRENPTALISTVEEMITLTPGILRDQGLDGRAGGTTKAYILQQIPEMLSHIDDDALRLEIVTALDNHKFKIGNQPAKTFKGHWGNDWKPNEILAKAQIVEAKRLDDLDKAHGSLALQDLKEAKQAYVDSGDQKSYKMAVAAIAEAYPTWTGLPKFLNDHEGWSPKIQTAEQSEATYNERTRNRPSGVITSSEAMYLDKEYRDILDKAGLIKDSLFGNDSPITQQKMLALTKDLQTFVKTNRNDLADKESLLHGDTRVMMGLAVRKRDAYAETLWNAGIYTDDDGIEQKVRSQAHALEIANQRIKAQMEDGKSKIGHWAELDAEGGYIGTEIKGIENLSIGGIQATHRLKTEALNIHQNKALNTSEDLLLKPLDFITANDLNPTTDPFGGYQISNTIKRLRAIDNGANTKGRDNLEIINTQRAARGLDLLPVSPKLKEVRDRNNSHEKIKARLALATAQRNGKAEEIEVDNLGFVSLPRMETAYKSSNQPIFSLTQNAGNLSEVLAAANLPPGMTHEQLLNDSASLAKVQRHLTNDMMKKASALTNNKADMVKMTAVGLRYGEGAMQNFDQPPYNQFALDAHRAYVSGSEQKGDPGVTAITEEDYMVTTEGSTGNVMHRELLAPEQRTVLESEIPTDLKSLEAQLTQLNEAPQPQKLTNHQLNKDTLADKWGFKQFLPNRVNHIWNNRRKSLQSRITIQKAITNPDTSWSENERVQIATSARLVIGDERFMELKEQAYATAGPSPFGREMNKELMRLLSLEPEFGGNDG